VKMKRIGGGYVPPQTSHQNVRQNTRSNAASINAKRAQTTESSLRGDRRPSKGGRAVQCQ